MLTLYIANILLAGWISFYSLFFPERALHIVFENTISYSEGIRLVGALWAGVFIISCIGIFFPREMQAIFLFQIVYKGIWLIVVAGPALYTGLSFPRGMAICFLIWVIVLPFVIEWQYLFGKSL